MEPISRRISSDFMGYPKFFQSFNVCLLSFFKILLTRRATSGNRQGGQGGGGQGWGQGGQGGPEGPSSNAGGPWPPWPPRWLRACTIVNAGMPGFPLAAAYSRVEVSLFRFSRRRTNIEFQRSYPYHDIV